MNKIEQAKNDILTKLESMAGEYSAVARAIGVDPSTIAKMVRAGSAANPRINMVIALHDHLFPRADSVGQGADAAQPEVFYGVDKGMSPVYQQVTLDKPRVCRRWVGRDQEKMQVGL